MIALNKKSKQAFQIINYSLKVIEHGSDTDFGKEKMVIYNPINRSQISVNRKDFEVFDNWEQVKPFIIIQEDEED